MNKLAKFIAQNRSAVSMINKKTGISKAVLYKWAKGSSTPRVTHAIEVERATRGFVSISSWK